MISVQEAARQVELVCRRLGLLHLAYARVLVDELGHDAGERLVELGLRGAVPQPERWSGELSTRPEYGRRPGDVIRRIAGTPGGRRAESRKNEMRALDLFDLSGRVAIITGASSGLGVWFSRGLAEAGADLVLAARRFQKLQQLAEDLRALGVRALPIEADVTRHHQVQQLVQAALREYGRIDILVNNAGVGPEEARIDHMNIDEFRKVMEVNLYGTLMCARAVSRVMIEQGMGRIINISSIFGLRADAKRSSAAYCASKAAVLNLTRELGKQLAPYGVRVNGIAPGLFPTEMTAWHWETPERAAKAVRSPLGRSGREDDMKGVIVFLASPASDYIVGQTIVVDGGQILT